MSDDSALKLHEKYILQLSLENKALQKKIDANSKEIEKYRRYNREILGRV